MWKIAAVFGLCLVTVAALPQTTSKYQVATVLEVKPHQVQGPGSDVTTYDVSLKVGDIIYVALYTPQLGESAAKHFAGQDLLVKVGKATLTYNDILGRSYEVPIQSEKPAPRAKEPRPSL